MRASDIRKQSFKSKLSGYDKEAVKQFIKEVAQTVDNLETSNQYMQQELYDKNAKLDEFTGKEAALNRSIVVAQEAADRLKEDALDEAELIIRRAQEEAERILREAAERALALNTETTNLAHVAENFYQQLLHQITGMKSGLEEERWSRLFDRAPADLVETPELDQVVHDLDLPLYNDKAEEIFELKNAEAEKKQAREAFFAQAEAKLKAASQDNDVPAIDPKDLDSQIGRPTTKGAEEA